MEEHTGRCRGLTSGGEGSPGRPRRSAPPAARPPPGSRTALEDGTAFSHGPDVVRPAPPVSSTVTAVAPLTAPEMANLTKELPPPGPLPQLERTTNTAAAA